MINPNPPTDIICNGFSLKQMVKDVLLKWEEYFTGELGLDFDKIAQEIVDEFALKARLKQGHIEQ